MLEKFRLILVSPLYDAPPETNNFSGEVKNQSGKTFSTAPFVS